MMIRTDGKASEALQGELLDDTCKGLPATITAKNMHPANAGIGHQCVQICVCPSFCYANLITHLKQWRFPDRVSKVIKGSYTFVCSLGFVHIQIRSSLVQHMSFIARQLQQRPRVFGEGLLEKLHFDLGLSPVP